ncbi:MAG: hypothetical protein ACI8XZ_003689 [Gammaproteobacteria bacterium]|jgi:hypothetical protein
MSVTIHPLRIVYPSILFLLFLSLPLASHAATVPLWSEVEYLVIADDVTAENTIRQETTIDPISEAFRLEKDGLVLDVAVGASWTDLGSGIVAFDHFRGDDNPNGFTRNWHGETSFRFGFSVDTASQIAIAYGALGTTTSISTTGLITWFAMHGFDITVERESGGPESRLLGFQNDFAPSNAPNPQRFDGTMIVALEPGTHMLELKLSEDAFGNFPGNRTMSGDFTFAIAETSPVPLPAAFWLLFAAAPLLCRTRPPRVSAQFT